MIKEDEHDGTTNYYMPGSYGIASFYFLHSSVYSAQTAKEVNKK
jgi:hypothetical protein